MSVSAVASYRLQLHRDFELKDVQTLIPYFENLFISHLYLSPLMESVRGSLHGYDVTDFTKISEERGGEESLSNLDRALRNRDKKMGIILDIVPNHMSVSEDNPFLQDVLANRNGSPYQKLFDFRPDKDGNIILPEISTDASDDTPLGYRRFFNIFDLIGIRVEDHNVYELTHRKLIELAERYPSITGVRVDHIDGLSDPAQYLDRLARNFGSVWVEKILTGDEVLPSRWPVLGTTGYEFINRLNSLMVNPKGFHRIKSFWLENIQSEWKDFYDCTITSRQEILHELFRPELERLIELSTQDETLREKARIFLESVTVTMPVYRTYVRDDVFNAQDIAYVHEALQKSRDLFGNDYSLSEVHFLSGFLDPRTDNERTLRKEWQQLTGPVMAKGVEDRAHYRFVPLAALNEVGCTPDIDPCGKENYFAWANRNAARYPHSLLCTTTHDTKRSEDVRHRLYALADMPEKWMEFYTDLNRITYNLFENGMVGNPERYMFYQTVVGTWPFGDNIDSDYTDRLAAYMNKAIREAGLHTNWLNPNARYEEVIDQFVRKSLTSPDFIACVEKHIQPILMTGAFNSLSVQALKILGPGMPDIYQGTETWNLSLVDPDNRRPVDYDSLQKTLAELESMDPPSVLHNLTREWRNGAIKQWTTQQLLKIRKEYIIPLKKPLSFIPLEVEGQKKDNVIAYTIESDSSTALMIVCPRYTGQMLGNEFNRLSIPAENWEDTQIVLPPSRTSWKNVLEHTTLHVDDPYLPLKDIASFPIAVLA